MRKVKVGLIGCGAISGIYLKNMTERYAVLEVVGCSDLRPERSERRAKEFGVRQMSNEEILADPEIEIVVNTTYPLSHERVSRAALSAGKHVVSEKMIAVTLEEGKALYELSRAQNRWLCVAPDTFMGAGLQTARRLIDAGLIGEPLHVNAVVARGYDLTGADGEIPFPFLPGGGIPFDMGGYYLHGMISLLGPIARVTGFSRTHQPDKPLLNVRNPGFGRRIDVQSPNHMTAALEFQCGALGTLTAISEVFGETPRLEVFGTEGILRYDDPNLYGDRVLLARKPREYRQPEFFEVPHTHGFCTDSRGLSVAELAWSLAAGRTPRAEAALGLHAFEVIHGAMRSCESGTIHVMKTTAQRPTPLPSGYLSEETEETALV